jgi:hypothetical protein
VVQGLIKEAVLALKKVWPKATCKTCCLEGIIEKPKCERKSMPRKGVATAASKNSNSKFGLEKQMVK